MPRLDYKTCKGCGRPASECGTLSRHRLCTVCGPRRQKSQQRQMFEHRGPEFLRWRRKVAASVGAVLLEDMPETLARAVVDYLTSASTGPNVTAA